MTVKYIVYGKPANEPCSYCRMAVDLLNREGAAHDYYPTARYEVDLVKEVILSSFGVIATTFPQIIKVENGTETYIGGYTELKESFEDLGDLELD